MNILKLAMIGFVTLMPFGAFAQVEFLSVPGITGTTEMDGISNLIPIATLTFYPSSFTVGRAVDSSSPQLQEAADAGKLYSSIFLYDFSPPIDGSQLNQITTFSNALVDKYVLLPGDGVGGEPLEEVSFAYSSMTVSAVPEPATVWLMLFGLGGLGFVARQRKAFSDPKAMQLQQT